MRDPLERFVRMWAAAILFANGWIFALPLTDAALPIVFTAIQVVRGVFVHEVLLVGYVGFVVALRAGRLPHATTGRSRIIGTLIATFGVLGIVCALVNLRPFTEVAGAARYVVLAVYFVLAGTWLRKYGPTFVLRMFLAGIAGAGAVNLYYTFTTQSHTLGGLPMLLGQNGPGGYLGIGVILSAWLMMERRSTRDTAVAVAMLVIGVLACSISFSKLAMLMAGAGVIPWGFVILRDFNTPRLRRWYALLVVVLAFALWGQRERIESYARGVNTFIEYKFRYLDKDSINTRSQYFLITAEIVEAHPLFGVGYGGFYEAALATKAEKSSKAAVENAESGARGESNPHSSFLYHAAGNGIPGFLMAIGLLAISLEMFREALVHRGIVGKVVWVSLAFGYLIFGLTLPTLFNTAILYLPVATAVDRAVRRPAIPRRRRVVADALSYGSGV